jgi:hypothetical protein
MIKISKKYFNAMKKIITTIITTLIFFNLYSQNIELKYDTSTKYKLDYTNPSNVVNGLIYGLKNMDYKLIVLVIDKLIDRDDHLSGSHELIRLRDDLIKKDKSLIDELNRKSKEIAWFINGDIIFSKSGDYAYVPVRTKWVKDGIQINARDAKFTLINRAGNWFLISFHEVVEK